MIDGLMNLLRTYNCLLLSLICRKKNFGHLSNSTIFQQSFMASMYVSPHLIHTDVNDWHMDDIKHKLEPHCRSGRKLFTSS